MQVSHKSIYTYIYILPRGELRKELISYLRQGRRGRQRRKRDTDERGKIPNMVSIHERPKEVAGRTVPGHWESDLIIGKAHASAIGTLVERTTRTTILVPLKAKDAETVEASLAQGDDMIDALATDRSDQPLCEAVLPRRAWRNRLVTDAHGP